MMFISPMLIKLSYSCSIVETKCPKEAFFYARLSITKTLNTFSIIKFDKIMINNGNHYHPADGVFVAPISGVCMFCWNTLTSNSKSLYTNYVLRTRLKVLLQAFREVISTHRDQLHYYVILEKENTSGYRQVVGQPIIICVIGEILRHSWDFCFRKNNCVVY